jgi:hypothetical protein
MNRTRIALCLISVSVASIAWAGPPADPRGGPSPVAVNGVYTVTFHVNLGSTVPTGSAVTCRARIAPNLQAFQNFNRGSAPVESAAAAGTVVASSLAGSTANCSVEIPFAWTVAETQNGVALSYEVDAVSGGSPVAARTQPGVAVPYPPQGSEARLSFSVTF